MASTQSNNGTAPLLPAPPKQTPSWNTSIRPCVCQTMCVVLLTVTTWTLTSALMVCHLSCAEQSTSQLTPLHEQHQHRLGLLGPALSSTFPCFQAGWDSSMLSLPFVLPLSDTTWCERLGQGFLCRTMCGREAWPSKGSCLVPCAAGLTKGFLEGALILPFFCVSRTWHRRSALLATWLSTELLGSHGFSSSRSVHMLASCYENSVILFMNLRYMIFYLRVPTSNNQGSFWRAHYLRVMHSSFCRGVVSKS